MPYVRIEITDEGVADDQKAEVIAGVTELLQRALGKDPATTFVVIDEVPVGQLGDRRRPRRRVAEATALRDLPAVG